MVRIGLTALVLAASLQAGDKPEPVRIALYVAIDEYHVDDKIRDLHGCVNDMRRLATTLSDGYGFRPYRLIQNKGATREGIKRGLTWLMDRVEKAHKSGARDIVVVFGYAGHGGLVKSTDGGERRDQTIVPSDGGRRYRKHIRDDDINRVLGRLQAEFGATVVYIRDSCHSGTAYRTASFAGTRSVVAAGDLTPPSSSEPSLFPKLRNRPNDRIVYLGAVTDSSLAEEGLDPSGEPCGKFSWSLSRVLARGREGMTYAELYGQLLTQFRKDWPESRHVPPGKISVALKDTKCFGSRRAPPHAHIVARIGKTVKLSQGLLHGVAKGSIFRFYKDLTDLEDGVREVAKATVTEVADATCSAEIEGEFAAAAVGRLDSVQFAEFKVGLLNGMPPHYKRVLDKLKMPVAEDAYAVALEHRDGRVYVYEPGRLSGDEAHLFEATSPGILEDSLAKYAAIRRLLALERNEGAIEVSFRPRAGHEKKELEPRDGMRRFRNGTQLDIAIKNTRPHVIHVFAFCDERSITESHKRAFEFFWPMDPGCKYEIKPGETLVLAPPDDYLAVQTAFEGGARFTVKLLLTQSKYDASGFSHMTQRTGVRADMDDLQKYLGNLGGGGGNRDATAATQGWWSTASIVFEVAG